MTNITRLVLNPKTYSLGEISCQFIIQFHEERHFNIQKGHFTPFSTKRNHFLANEIFIACDIVILKP